MESNDTSEEGNAFKHLTKYLACFSFLNSLQSSTTASSMIAYWISIKNSLKLMDLFDEIYVTTFMFTLIKFVSDLRELRTLSKIMNKAPSRFGQQ